MHTKLRQKGDMLEDQIRYGIRVSMGIIFAIVVAILCDVEFAPSTGVVALLSIQTTKRETLKNVFIRILSAAYTFGIAIVMNHFFPDQLWGFSLTVLAVVLLSVLLHWEMTLSVNVVIMVHLFVQDVPFTYGLIQNEIIRLIIGISVAVLVNLHFPKQKGRFRRYFNHVETQMEQVLQKMADGLNSGVVAEDLPELMTDLKEEMTFVSEKSLNYYNNHFGSDRNLYMHYMDLRSDEMRIMEIMYHHLLQLQQVQGKYEPVVKLLETLAQNVSLDKSVTDTLAVYTDTKTWLESKPIPQNRESFLDEARIFQILSECRELLSRRQQYEQNRQVELEGGSYEIK